MTNDELPLLRKPLFETKAQGQKLTPLTLPIFRPLLPLVLLTAYSLQLIASYNFITLCLPYLS